MKCILSLATVLALAGDVFAQVDTAWVRNLVGPSMGIHRGNAIWATSDGGAVITGEAIGVNGKTDLIVSRYSPSGDVVWTDIYDGPLQGDDAGRLVQTDESGAVYVTGLYEYSLGLKHVLLLKYSPTGERQWIRTMEIGDGGRQKDSVTAMCIDCEQNVLITGESLTDYFADRPLFVRKYDPDGVVLWHRTYQFTTQWTGADDPFAIISDSNCNIYVIGATLSFAGVEGWNFLLLKYTPVGYRAWLKIYNSAWNGDDVGKAVALGEHGSVYVTGTSTGETGSIDYLTLKYDSTGALAWNRRYIGPAGGDDIAIGIGVDDAGAIYVGGQTRGFFSLEDFHVVKYDTAAIPVWDRQYTGPGFSVDIPNSFRVSRSGISYISGASSPGGSAWEFATVAYDSSGFLHWRRRYGGNTYDSAASMYLDTVGNVYVTGKSQVSGSQHAITSIKYAVCSPPAPVEPAPVTSNESPCKGEPFTVSWAPSSGSTTYELYEDGSFVSTGPDTFRTITRATGTYTFTVRARHSECGSAGFSEPGALTTIQCTCHGDSNCDGAIDIVDVTSFIGEAFRGIGSTLDQACINPLRSDVDCDCAVTITDVVKVVSVAFRGMDAASTFCNPCSSPCP